MSVISNHVGVLATAGVQSIAASKRLSMGSTKTMSASTNSQPRAHDYERLAKQIYALDGLDKGRLLLAKASAMRALTRSADFFAGS